MFRVYREGHTRTIACEFNQPPQKAFTIDFGETCKAERACNNYLCFRAGNDAVHIASTVVYMYIYGPPRKRAERTIHLIQRIRLYGTGRIAGPFSQHQTARYFNVLFYRTFCRGGVYLWVPLSALNPKPYTLYPKHCDCSHEFHLKIIKGYLCKSLWREVPLLHNDI